MINKMKTRTGGYKNGVANSAKYLLKTDPKGDSIDSSIARLDGESDQAYANRIEKIFESARVPNQKNLYQHNALAFHPSDGEKLTDAQMIDIAKEVYLKNGLGENRHYLFVVERNTEHPHVHALLHLTDLDTNRVNNKFIKYNPILEKLENKYGLYNQHRMPTPENTTPSNDQKSEKDLKKDFKTELKAILENALTASEFLMLANGAGFDIHHSGKDAYSMTKDGQTFKASDLAVSYKTLKAALGDDPEFAATLASLHTDKPGNDDSGSITAPVSEGPAPANKASASAGDDDPADHGSQSSNEEKTKFVKGPRNKKTLYVNYHHDDQGNYFFNRDDKKAFEYDAKTSTVKYSGCTPSSVKAGLQKLTEDGNPCVLYTGGGEKFKRETWMQFHLMNLEDKGYTLEGFKPSLKDVEELERKIEERDRYYNRDQESNIKSLPTENIIEKPLETLSTKPTEKAVEPLASKTTEKPVETLSTKPTEKPVDKSPKNNEKINTQINKSPVNHLEDTTAKSYIPEAKEGETTAEKSSKSGAAGLADGLVKTLDVFAVHDDQGPMNEMLSEMRVLDAQIKENQNQSENEQHQNERRRLQKLTPQ